MMVPISPSYKNSFSNISNIVYQSTSIACIKSIYNKHIPQYQGLNINNKQLLIKIDYVS